MVGTVQNWQDLSLSLMVSLVAGVFSENRNLNSRSFDLYPIGCWHDSRLYLRAFRATAVAGVNLKSRCPHPNSHRLAESHIYHQVCLRKATLGFVDHREGNQS